MWWPKNVYPLAIEKPAHDSTWPQADASPPSQKTPGKQSSSTNISLLASK